MLFFFQTILVQCTRIHVNNVEGIVETVLYCVLEWVVDESVYVCEMFVPNV